MEWQPIETAPRDGTPILMFVRTPPPSVLTGAGIPFVIGELWHSEDEEVEIVGPFGEVAIATHWMPLPSPPQGE